MSSVKNISQARFCMYHFKEDIQKKLNVLRLVGPLHQVSKVGKIEFSIKADMRGWSFLSGGGP